MELLDVNAGLVGAQVRNAARPEWGDGTILRVQPTQIEGLPAHRVSVQFPVGHRTLMVPPARLVTPTPEPQRRSGWLEGVSKTTLDDRLRSLPESVTDVLGAPRARLAAVTPLYDSTDDSDELLRWARSQTGVSDPLTQWTRDELLAALQDFRMARDAHMRNLAAIIKQKEGPQALRDSLNEFPEPTRQAVREALRRII